MIILFDTSYLSRGGVPNEHRNIFGELVLKNELLILTYKGKSEINHDNHFNLKIMNKLELFRYLFKDSHITSVIFPGYFNIDNVLAVLICWVKKIPYFIFPYSQVTKYSMLNDLFEQDPEIRKLEISNIKKERVFLAKIIPVLKRIFHNTVGVFLLKNAKGIFVFSEYEKRQIISLSNIKNKQFHNIRWGIDKVDFSRSDFYSAFRKDHNKIILTYWGRIDLFTKGIDRILKILHFYKIYNRKVNFETFIIGPSYREGKLKLFSLIEKMELQEDIRILDERDYNPGDKQPLIDCDVSIYLSRWDGYPRTIRESLIYKIPLIVSEETHFSEIIDKYNVGISIPSAVDDFEYFEYFSSFVNHERLSEIRENYEKNYYEILEELKYLRIGNNIIKVVNEK